MKTTLVSLTLALALAAVSAPAGASAIVDAIADGVDLDGGTKRLQASTGPADARAARHQPLNSPVVLHDHVVVSGPFVRLGDLFANAGAQADVNVAYAPDPGDKATFDAHWLYRVAQAYELDWQPRSRLDQAVVQRDSLVIGRDEIEDRILDALISRYDLAPEMQVELSHRMVRLNLPVDSDGRIAIEDVVYDTQSRRFTAVVVAPADSPSAQRHRLTGQLHRMLEVPALTRRILSGEVIDRADLQWVRVRADRLPRNAVTNAEDLLGKTPKRSLRAGRPVRAGDVQRPVLVPRGSLVTMVLKSPLMTLTAQGKALENGSEGDVVRVSNSKSNQVVEAVVIGTNRVTVRPANHVLMN